MMLSGCGEQGAPKSLSGTAETPKPPRRLRIAAAADLKFALVDLVSAFGQSHPDAKVIVTDGSSGSLFAQLTNEAPFDLFLSADIDYPRKLIEQGQGVKESEFEYATGHLVLWAARDMPLDVEHDRIGLLRDEIVQRIAVANPRTAPYGRAAIEALKNLGVYDAAESRLVFGDNVAQTAQMIESGGADVGMLSLSLALSPALRDKGKYWMIPGDAHPPIVQGGVVLRWAEDPELAKEFCRFLLSTEGREVLKRFGFEPAGE
jgi:molybdate transport system substrate-binding protein